MPQKPVDLLALWYDCPVHDGIRIGNAALKTFIDGALVDGGADDDILKAVRAAADGDALWREAVDVALGGLHDREDGEEMANRLMFLPVWGPLEHLDSWLRSEGLPKLLHALHAWVKPHVDEAHVAELDLIACPVALHPSVLAVSSPDALRALLMGLVFQENVGGNVAFSEPQTPSVDMRVSGEGTIGVRLIAVALSARMAPGYDGEGHEFFARLEAAAGEDSDDEEQDRWFDIARHHDFPSALSLLPPASLAPALTSSVISRLVSGWNMDLADLGLPLDGSPLESLRRHIIDVDVQKDPSDDALLVIQATTSAGPLSPVVLPRSWATIGALTPVAYVVKDLLAGEFLRHEEFVSDASSSAPQEAPRRPVNRRLH